MPEVVSFPVDAPPPGAGPVRGPTSADDLRSQLSPEAVRAAYHEARPPSDVHRAFLAFATYLAVGLLSGLVGVVFAAFVLTELPGGAAATIGGSVVLLLLALVLYVAVLFVMVQMRAGRAWARVVLTVLAVVGLLVAVLGAIGALMSFGAATALYGEIRAVLSPIFALVQAVLLTAGLWWMYRPTPAGYFH